MPKDSLNISALCAEFCTNIVCPSCGLASAMSWLRHCCWRLECSSCQRGEKKNSLVVKTEVITWSVKGLTKAGRHCERGKSLCCVCCRATEDRKVKALLCEGQYQKWLLCWCHSGPVWRTQLERTIFSLSHLLSTQPITERQGGCTRFGLPQLKA